jgi:hypothetical protein
VALVLAAPVGGSYAGALRAPGTDTVEARTVEWLRDHDGGPIVDLAERWWYAWNEPALGGLPAAADRDVSIAPPAMALPAGASTTPKRPPPAPLTSPAATPLPDEGVWRPFGPLVDGEPAAWVTSVRPDARHTAALVRVVWLDSSAFRFEQFEGDKIPRPWVRPSLVPAVDQPRLVAAFSTGFRISGSKGGFWLLGEEKNKLRAKAASLVVDDQGRIGVGLVGRDYPLEHLESVRQNLDLVVDGGRVAARLVEEPNEQWGYTGPDNHTAAWRSGAGTRADGSFVYVVGPALSIVTLGETLVRAGAVRGMQLEINREWISFNTYAAGTDGTVHGTRLDKAFVHPGDRYLTEDTRDFMGVFVRPPGDPVVSPRPSLAALP